ncbi:hypothetical protein BH11PLA2_BH11PLA2_30430 [soil metagenome]
MSASTVDVEDVLPVHSRVSWGAILAGAFIALSLYFLLTLLAGAIGMSISDKTTAKTITVAAAVWAIAITAVCLFCGGLVAANFTTGENKLEAALYGILVWAVVFATIIWLMATGVRAGFGAMVGVATAGSSVAHTAALNTTQSDWESVARQAGFTQSQIDEVKQRAQNTPAQVKAASEDPATQAKIDAAAKEASDVATKVTWWTFFGTWFAMAAAAGGGYCGAGPTFRLAPVVRARVV